MTLRRTSMTWLPIKKPLEKQMKYVSKFWTDANAEYYYDAVNDEFWRVIQKPHELWFRSTEGLGR